MQRTSCAIVIALILLALGGCMNQWPPSTSDEEGTGTGYQPLDPIPIVVSTNAAKPVTNQQLLVAIPSESMRLAVARVSASGRIAFAPVAVGVSGQTYTVILDYIKYTSAPIKVRYYEHFVDENGRNITDRERGIRTSSGKIDVMERVDKSRPVATKFSSTRPSERVDESAHENDFEVEHRIPVYVGVGLRIQANVTVMDSSVDLTSLFNLGLAASQNRVRGSLIIQTLGISGSNVSSAIPLPSELNPTTIQNAIQALATIKSKLYDETTIIAPQVVGFENPYALPGSASLIVATIQSTPINGVASRDGAAVTFQAHSDELGPTTEPSSCAPIIIDRPE